MLLQKVRVFQERKMYTPTAKLLAEILPTVSLFSTTLDFYVLEDVMTKRKGIAIVLMKY